MDRYYQNVTFLHAVLLGSGLLLGLAASDILTHRNIGSWPLGLAIIGLIVVTAVLRSGELMALTLGSGVAFCGVVLFRWSQELSEARRIQREHRETMRKRRHRQLEHD